MIYLQLFLSFFKIGLLGFGGGMAIISLVQNEVEIHGWMTSAQFLDILAISQVTPGPVGINVATYVGYTASGTVWGSLLASLAIILPSLIIMGLLCYLYESIRQRWSENKIFRFTMRMIRILVVVLIANAAYRLMTPATFMDYSSWVIFAVAALCTLLPEVKKNRMTETLSHPILLILVSAIVGLVIYR